MNPPRIRLRINIDAGKASNLSISLRVLRAADVYVFSVAIQIFNLPYRRFVIGRTLLAGGSWQVKNLRHSRLQVCATGAASSLNTYEGEGQGEGKRPFARYIVSGIQKTPQ